MEKIRMTIVTDLGDTYSSKWDEFSEEGFLEFRRTLSNFTNLSSLNLTTKAGALTYFNPRHVVSVAIERR